MQKHKIFTIVSSLLVFTCTQTHGETLQQTIEYAIETNPNVLIASSNRLATDQVLRQSKAGYLPTVDLFAAYGRERSKNPGTGASPAGPEITLTRSEAGVIAIQNLFEGFRTMNQVAENQAKVLAAAHEVNSSAQDIALRVARVYLNVMRRQRIVELAAENVKVHKKTMSMIKKRYQGGLSHRADLTQAQGRLALSESNLIAERSRLAETVVEFIQIVGKEPGDLEIPTIDNKYLPKGLKDAVNISLQNNPELEAARENIVAARKQYAASKATNYPSLNIELSSSRNDNLDGIKGVNNDDQAMLTANYNIFNGGADLARQKEIAYFLQAAIQTKNLTERQTIESTKLAWINYATARDQLPFLRIHKKSSAETVGLYAKQFRLDERSLLDLLDSETEKFTSSVSYVDGKFRELLGKYELLAVMGRIVDATNTNLPAEASTRTRVALNRTDVTVRPL